MMFCFHLLAFPGVTSSKLNGVQAAGVKTFVFAERLFVALLFLGSPSALQLFPVNVQGSGRQNGCNLIDGYCKGLAILRAHTVLHTGMVSTHLNNI